MLVLPWGLFQGILYLPYFLDIYLSIALVITVTSIQLSYILQNSHRSSYDNETADGNVGANQVMSEFSSTVTEVLSEKGMNVQGNETHPRQL